VGLERKDLMQREAVGDETLLEEALASPDHLTLQDAELLRDGGVGPEGAAVTVGSQVEKEQERDLLHAQAMKDVSEAVVHPGKMAGDGTHSGRVDRLAVRHRCTHVGGVYRPLQPEDREADGALRSTRAANGRG
jgi:hypothetical protein